MPMLASPATESPATTDTARGRNSPISMVSAASATKRPFSVMDRKKFGASWPGCDSVLLTATEMRIGTPASTTQAGLVAAAAEDQSQLREQEAGRDRRHRTAYDGRRAVSH